MGRNGSSSCIHVKLQRNAPLGHCRKTWKIPTVVCRSRYSKKKTTTILLQPYHHIIIIYRHIYCHFFLSSVIIKMQQCYVCLFKSLLIAELILLCTSETFKHPCIGKIVKLLRDWSSLCKP